MIDSPVLALAISAVAGYALGSVPLPYLVVHAVRGEDLRTRFTGNVGVMNAGRVLGRRGLVAVFVAELAKGVLAAWIGLRLQGPQAAWVAVNASVVGANWPIWLGWSGGRGNSTFIGGLLVVSPVLTALLGSVWLLARGVLRSAFRATRLNIVLMPVQVAAWSWWQYRAAEQVAFFTATSLVATLVFLTRHRADTDDHMAIRGRAPDVP